MPDVHESAHPGCGVIPRPMLSDWTSATPRVVRGMSNHVTGPMQRRAGIDSHGKMEKKLEHMAEE